MKEFENYRDLIIRRDINKDVLDTYVELKEQIDKEILRGPSDIAAIDLGSIGSKSTMTMGIYIEQIEQINNQIKAAMDIVNKIDEKIELIEKKLSKLEGLDYQIMYLKETKGYTLKEIAEELNYSYQYIRKVYSEI